MSTPHNNANPGDIAKTVLMPGDPLRAKYLAEHYLDNPVCFNTIRNMFGYTGYYKGHRISIMGSGMGMASIGIYSYELFKFYDVDNIIRIGSAGGYKKEYELFDVVIVKDAYSESTFAKAQGNITEPLIKPSSYINDKILETAKELNIPYHYSTVHSSDVFYHEPNSKYMEEVNKYDCGCVEMESFSLFSNAMVTGKNAACILTISDSLVSKKETTAEQRQNSFNLMMELALETAIKL